MTDTSSGPDKMINRSELFKDAWAIYRKANRFARAPWLPVPEEATFARALHEAWRIHKNAAARVAAALAARAKEQAALAGPNGEAIRRVKQAIDELSYKGFRHNIAAEREALKARLSALVR